MFRPPALVEPIVQPELVRVVSDKLPEYLDARGERYREGDVVEHSEARRDESHLALGEDTRGGRGAI